MRKSAVIYTLDSCVKCLKCVRACPVSALTMNADSRIEIDGEKCLNCARCITTCHSKGLLGQGSTLEDIPNYDYSICMVPPALINVCSTKEEADEMMYAIKQLGFDEVVDISPVYGQIMNEYFNLADHYVEGTMITSFCPVVNRYIQTKYPMLLDNLAPINYPSEIAAKMIREQHKDKGNVGIFHCCECEALLELAKYPYLNEEYETDHALAIVDIFPKIRKHLKENKMKCDYNLQGLQSVNPSMILQKENYLIADGFEKITNILDLAEFDMLKDFKLLYLFACFNGCVGGHLLFGNSYLYRNNVYPLTKNGSSEVTSLPFDDIYSDFISLNAEDKRSFKEKMAFFAKVNEQLEKLPGYDCSACGLQTCRIMAEEIAKGNKTLDHCHILALAKEKENETT
ncbi:MAG: 4Fe-4S dicluster domain-containing protein [Solobacterium sp.]|nr:4Fe-4S dicluster domain-containing protein [Solobacterium sp.]